MVNYLGWGGCIGGGLIILIIIWYFLKNRGGRISEEKEEESETGELEKDEEDAKKAEKDEKTRCRILMGLFKKIIERLNKIQKGNIPKEIVSGYTKIDAILDSLAKEKMSVKKALNIFRRLHNLINDFLYRLPKTDREINKFIKKIQKHQDKYYKDLIEEVKMDEEKKKILRVLWEGVVKEEDTGFEGAA